MEHEAASIATGAPRVDEPRLTERQRQVLHVVASGFIGEPTPIGSATVSHLLPVKLSSASIRATMAELTDLGLLEKPHASAGRVPTERGLRHFVMSLLRPGPVGAWMRRQVDASFEELGDLGRDAALRQASQLLSEHTGQLGFVLTPRLETAVLRHVSLVRVSRERLLVVLVSQAGQAHQRVIEDPGAGDQAELDRIASLLNERVCGHSLAEARAQLFRDLVELRDRADRWLRRALELGLRVADASEDEEADLVIATHLALLEQPEFQDPERLRELFAALATRERLVEVIDRVLEAREVSVRMGEDLARAGLERCAVVVAPCGPDDDGPRRGAVGVIGPTRMDYPRIIPLVSYCSRLFTETLSS